MTEKHYERLLGGYATGTLTAAERRVLLEASLHDQELFNALADEQALKELLDDPVSRRRLLDALEKASAQSSTSWTTSVLVWLKRPATLGLAGSLATAVLALVVVTTLQREQTPQPVDDVVTADPQRPKQRPAVHARPAEQDDLAAERLRMSEPERRAEKEGKRVPTEAEQTRTVSTPPVEPSASLEAEGQPVAPLLKSAKPRPSEHGSESVASSRPDVLVPPLSEPAAELKTKQATPAKVSRLPEASRGPARELYYRGTRQGAPSAPLGTEEGRARDQRAQYGAQESTDSPVMGKRTAPPTGSLSNVLGLRYSILKQAQDGTYRETTPKGPFRAGDALRLTLEVNEPGYLYVLRQIGAAEWTWLFPSASSATPRDAKLAPVASRRRYVIPLDTALVPTKALPSTRIIIVFSRQARPHIHALIGQPAQGKPGAGPTAGGIRALLEGVTTAANVLSLISEEVTAGTAGHPSEQAVYLVNRSPAPDALILAQIELSHK